MSMDSAATMGAAASKKCSSRSPGSVESALVSAGSVSGPVAMMQGASGRASTSAVSNLTRGCSISAFVMHAENFSRSTASAPPAGTRASSAARRMSESSRRISAFKRPEALVKCSAFSELEQTNSANPSMWWAGENFFGFMSTSRTATPRRASCQAASQPARPAPTMVTLFVILGLDLHAMAAAFVDADVVMRVPRPALVDHARTAHGALVVHWAVPGDEIALR